jgi:hydroxymethylpyrimidine/phosphomethylpyrimidine kinase
VLANSASGLEADQRTLAAHGVYAMTATTALTAQNTLGVDDVHITPPEFVGKQINKVMDDGFLEDPPGLVKIGRFLDCGLNELSVTNDIKGMLASAATIEVVAHTLSEWQRKSDKQIDIVLDPVWDCSYPLDT